MSVPIAPTRPVQSSLATYFRDISATPLLSPEEERRLTRRVKAGDREARDRLVRANLRLVVRIARRYTGRGLDLPDLIQEGNLGLLRAAGHFDPARNTRFGPYAFHVIRQAILAGIKKAGKLVRTPAYTADLLAKWHRAKAQLGGQLGHPPAPEDVARHLDLPEHKRHVVRQAMCACNLASLTDPDEAGWSVGETLLDGRARTPDAELIEVEDRGRALEALEGLDERWAAVLRMRFGWDGEEPQTHREIGERLGRTRSRVQQIEKAALDSLRRQVGAPSTVPRTAA